MSYEQKKIIIKIFIIILLILSIIFIITQHYILGIIFITFMILTGIYYLRINKIIETTLCLIVKDNKVLMMLRNKKKNDVHMNKYNGLGGHLEKGESKEACVLREVYEEAGIELTDYDYVGKVIFKNFGYKKGKEVMYCFVGYDYKNEIGACNEGELQWIDEDAVMNLPLWEGDQYFLMNIIHHEPFHAYLHYDGDRVVDHKIILKR